jgi:hypothetical protein
MVLFCIEQPGELQFAFSSGAAAGIVVAKAE